MRHSVSLLVSLVLFLQPACAHRPPASPSEEIRAGLGTIGVFSVQDIPKSSLNPFAKGPLEGASRAVDSSVRDLGSPPGDPLGCLLWSICVGGFTATSAVVGTTQAVSTEEAEPMEAPIRIAFSNLRIQETIAEDILKAAGELKIYAFYPRWQAVSPGAADYGRFEKDGIDTALEVAVTSVGFEDVHWKDEPAAFLMTLHARLIRTADNAVLYENEFIYKSPHRMYTDWGHNDARLFAEAFQCACEALADKLMEEVFLRYELRTFGGLKPEYPKILKDFWHSEPIIPKIDSLQPTFKWESFPTEYHLESVKQELLSQITEVTYDLKIWRAENNCPGKQIYSRQGLPEASHKIEISLEPCAKYFWSTSARFRLNGQTRVTGWGGFWQSPYYNRSCYYAHSYWWFWWSPQVPNPAVFSFKTPCP